MITFRQFAEDHGYYDANPGGSNTAIQLQGYGVLAYELYDELRDAPRLVAVPVSNGTTLASIYRGFLSLYRRGKTSHLPIIIAGSSTGKNPIVLAHLKGLKACELLDPSRIHETKINEPLINWQSIDGDLALAAIWATGGWTANASDRSMSEASKRMREKEGLHGRSGSGHRRLAALCVGTAQCPPC